MTAVMDTFSLLNGHVTWVDGIYPKLIPEEIPANQTSLLIRDAYSSLGNYGGNTFNTVSQNIIIQIYYSLESDPDTGQDYQTIQVKRITVLKEK